MQQEVLGRTNSPTFATCHLFELLELSLMELNLSELTLAYSVQFNLIKLTLLQQTTWLLWLPWNIKTIQTHTLARLTSQI
jgi:hypothetical protein